MSHISLTLNGTDLRDTWWVENVQLLRNKEWHILKAPDASHNTMSTQAQVGSNANLEVEWFDMNPKDPINTIRTRWTTDTQDWSDSSNIFTVYFHSNKAVHYAGVIHDPKAGDTWNIDPADCPFPVEDLRMVSVKALRSDASDNWIVRSVALETDGRYVELYGQQWNGKKTGEISYHNNALQEPIFTLHPILARVVTGNEADHGSSGTFSVWFHTYTADALEAEIVSPMPGDHTILVSDFPALDKLSHITLARNDTGVDDWWVSSVEIYRDGKWDQFFAPEASHTTSLSAAIDVDHPAVECCSDTASPYHYRQHLLRRQR
ncbi:hypothetical protein DIPPA_03705 [Diplonema papillatum]|nr:hypothetical protein DIPPA_03705 [Diplonema papillatum]